MDKKTLSLLAVGLGAWVALARLVSYNAKVLNETIGTVNQLVERENERVTDENFMTIVEHFDG